MHRHDIIINKTNFAGISNYSKVSLWALEEIHKLKGKLNSSFRSKGGQVTAPYKSFPGPLSQTSTISSNK